MKYVVLYHCGVRAPRWVDQRRAGQRIDAGTSWSRAGVEFASGVFLSKTPLEAALQGFNPCNVGRRDERGTSVEGDRSPFRHVYAIRVPVRHPDIVEARFDDVSEVIVTSEEAWGLCRVLGKVSERKLARRRASLRSPRAANELRVAAATPQGAAPRPLTSAEWRESLRQGAARHAARRPGDALGIAAQAMLERALARRRAEVDDARR